MDELVSEEVKDLANCCATSSQKFSTVSALQLTGMCYLKEEEEEEIKKKFSTVSALQVKYTGTDEK